ncbi:hypothetical protein, conserved [Babesia bigemina]|uniref:Uncharacterized protein n=1 Tax=Babesia bigemina TaxID=5866 RepID=A0A061BKE7_BABBI|nr:hypothetical protein, conserved [Babesia bigemina]CDR71945.1 hypothetical protein, conserved [Babesia bigemina]|eukprot:XP_012770887.1 hypothetical protein, conserved [Babesia bigemina]
MTSINHPNNLCLVTLHFPSSTSCHCPDHVPPRELDQKFDENKKCEITSNNNPTNILNNLCTGLETFLGFNSASKGYTGQGIVYSDLDRLCDGVMAFLHGVLESVKDDTNVKTYYSVDKMTETLNTIKDSMHKTGGLSAAVTAVSTALGEWDREVTEKTNALKNGLNELKNNNFSSMQNALDNLNALSHSDQLSSVADKLHTCIDQATFLSGAYDAAEKEYDKLDPTLRDKMKDALNKIKLQVEHFHGAAANTELKGLLEEGEKQLNVIENAIRNEVEGRVGQYKLLLKHEFDEKIKSKIHDINEALKTHIANLFGWIEKAGPLVWRSLQLVEVIVKEVNNSTERSQFPMKIRKAAQGLYEDAVTLRRAMKTAYDNISNKVNIAISQLGTLENGVKSDLASLRDAIKNTVGSYAKETLAKKIGDGLTPIANEIYQKMNGTGCLNKIVSGINDYATKFKQDKSFGGIVQKWIEDIMDEDVSVKGFLDGYFKQPSTYKAPYNKWVSKGEHNAEITAKLAGLIKNELSTEIQQSASIAVSDSQSGAGKTEIEQHVAAVTAACMLFASQLEGRLKAMN